MKSDLVFLVLAFEIFLFMSFVPVNSYSLGEIFGNGNLVSEFFVGMRNLIFSEKTLVSAKTNPITGAVQNNPTQVLDLGGDFMSGVLDEMSGGGIETCTVSKDGAICQEFTKKICEEVCAGECLDGERAELEEGSDCEVGICFDPSEGTCSPRATRKVCEDFGGEFLSEDSNDPRCEKGCCVLGSSSLFITETRCRNVAQTLGLIFGDTEGGNYFDGTVNNELLCLGDAEANSERQGACVFDLEDKRDCVFVSASECYSITGSSENFYPEMLCSHGSLDTICEKQNITRCVEGRDEVFWFDSCGNQENIFEGDSKKARDESWNLGMIKSKNESCKIKSGSNNVGNQDDCGNCARFLGSICGEEDDEQELDDSPDGGVVCKNLGCYEEDGTRRENGESWCAYQSKVGVSSGENPLVSFIGGFWGGSFGGILGGERGRDTPGSEHFRVSCMDGEIHVEPCQDHRNNVCVEGKIEKEGGGEFTTASCRMNRWQECLNYNPTSDGDEGEMMGKIKTEIAMNKCNQDPDCFVKEVKIDDGFEFPVCLPKYPPGFDTVLNPQGAEQICSFGSQTCTAVFVYEAKAYGAGGLEWECVANCDCVEGDTPDDAKPSREFIEKMNEMCVSLGDCGSSVNYMGHFPGGKGYDAKTEVGEDGIFGRLMSLIDLSSVFDFDLMEVMTNAGDADADPDFSIIEDSNATLNSVGDSLDSSLGGVFDTIGEFLGIDLDFENEGGGSPPRPDLPNPDIDDGTGLTNLGYVSGGLGMGMTGLAHAGLLPTSLASFGVGGGSLSVAGGLTKGQALVDAMHSGGSITGPQFSAFGGAIMGAAMGASAVTMLIQMTGIGPGIGAGQMYGLVGAGAVGGAMVGYAGAVAMQGAAEMGAGITEAIGALMQFPGLDKIFMAGKFGIIILVIVIITIIVLKLLGAGEIKEVNVQFECKPWEAPLGGDNCELCGSEDAEGLNDGISCSRYACQSLGQACTYIDQDPYSVCVDLNPNDVASPEVVDLDESVLVADFGYEGVTDSGFSYRRSGERECMSQYDLAIFSLETDELAKCRLGKLGSDSFNLMSDFGSGVYLKKNHTFYVPAAELLELVEGYEEGRTEVNLFMKCVDAHGNVPDVSDYVINFCIDPLDLSAPVFSIEGGQNSVVKYVTEEHDLGIVLLEDAECKMDYLDNEYDLMSDEFYCASEVERDGASPRCVIEGIPLDLGNNEFYIRCKDHPEFEGTNRSSERNANADGVLISVFRTEEPLNVSVVAPVGLIEAGTPIVSNEILAWTSGGIQEGKATCEFILDEGQFAIMEETGGIEHRQIFDLIVDGVHNVTVRCIDFIGNEGTGESEFELERDLIAPKVTRVYEDDGDLVVITDERSECYFVNGKQDDLTDFCGFELESGEKMSGDGLEHRENFDKLKTYYVRCQDIFENKIAGCGIVVKGAEF